MVSGTFRLQADGTDISLQRHTSEAPNDGRYHLLRGDRIMESFNRESEGIKAFRALLQETGYEPPERQEDKRDLAEILREEKEELERYRSEMYWGHSHQYGSGGKLSNR